MTFPEKSLVFQFAFPNNIKIKIYRIIVLPVVLYGCKTWSRTLTAERRPRVFNSTVLRKIFGPKEYEVTGE
jgi:hypothetical protein